jgi:hypothetical protein
MEMTTLTSLFVPHFRHWHWRTTLLVCVSSISPGASNLMSKVSGVPNPWSPSLCFQALAFAYPAPLATMGSIGSTVPKTRWSTNGTNMSVPILLILWSISGRRLKSSIEWRWRKYLKNISPYHCRTWTPCFKSSGRISRDAGDGHRASMRCFSFNALRTMRSSLALSNNFFSSRSCTSYLAKRTTSPRTNPASRPFSRIKKSRDARSFCAWAFAGRKVRGVSS